MVDIPSFGWHPVSPSPPRRGRVARSHGEGRAGGTLLRQAGCSQQRAWRLHRQPGVTASHGCVEARPRSNSSFRLINSFPPFPSSARTSGERMQGRAWLWLDGSARDFRTRSQSCQIPALSPHVTFCRTLQPAVASRCTTSPRDPAALPVLGDAALPQAFHGCC